MMVIVPVLGVVMVLALMIGSSSGGHDWDSGVAGFQFCFVCPT